MYASWGYPNTLSWTSTSGPCDGSWKGVSCNNNNQVSNLALGSLGLNYQLNPAIGNLTALSSIMLNSNTLTGPIPSTLSRLTNLVFMDIGTNKLSGSVPAQVSTLTQLTKLSFGTNKNTGTIPPQLSTLVNLVSFYLDHSLLTGSIPAQLSTLNQLTVIGFAQNSLTNVLPQSLSQIYNNMGNGRRDRFMMYNNALLCGSISNFNNFDTGGTQLGNSCPNPPRECRYPPIAFTLWGYLLFTHSCGLIKDDDDK